MIKPQRNWTCSIVRLRGICWNSDGEGQLSYMRDRHFQGWLQGIHLNANKIIDIGDWLWTKTNGLNTLDNLLRFIMLVSILQLVNNLSVFVLGGLGNFAIVYVIKVTDSSSNTLDNNVELISIFYEVSLDVSDQPIAYKFADVFTSVYRTGLSLGPATAWRFVPSRYSTWTNWLC